MANINKELNKIKNAVYGREVRQAIHDSIKKTYDDAAENGNANMEVVMARGTENTLGNRLDKMHNKQNDLTSQLNETNSQLAQNEPVLAQTLSNEEVDIYLVYGQSNARGYANNTPGDPNFKTPNVTVWDGTQEIPLTNYMPTQNDGTSTGGAWVAFANEYARKTGRKAIIANCANGSQSIAQLSKGAENTNYSGLVSWGNSIKTHITNSGKKVGKTVILFNQGERDSMDQTPSTEYKTDLETLWSDIKTDIGADLFAIFTVGYYNDNRKIYAWAIQSVQRKFARINEDVLLVFDDIESLNAHGMKVDGVHLNQVGYNYMGEEGAKTLVDTLFTDGSYQQEEFIKRQGVINLDGSQEWKMYGGWLNGPNFQPSVTTNRATSNIIAVSVEADHLAITLADKIDYILSVGASLKSYDNGVSQPGTAGIKPTFDRKIYQTVDSEGRTVVKIYFIADITARLRMSNQTIDTSALGIDLSSIFSVEWSNGTAVISHPITDQLTTACVSTLSPYFLSCRPTNISTTVRAWDSAGVLASPEVTVNFKSIKIPPALLSNTTELTFNIIATERTAS